MAVDVTRHAHLFRWLWGALSLQGNLLLWSLPIVVCISGQHANHLSYSIFRAHRRIVSSVSCCLGKQHWATHCAALLLVPTNIVLVSTVSEDVYFIVALCVTESHSCCSGLSLRGLQRNSPQLAMLEALLKLHILPPVEPLNAVWTTPFFVDGEYLETLEGRHLAVSTKPDAVVISNGGKNKAHLLAGDKETCKVLQTP